MGAPSIVTPVGPLSSARPFVFAAALYLGLNRGRPVRRDELAALLWPDASDAKRGERTRWLVRQLRLAGIATHTSAPELSLPSSDVELDVDRLAAAPSAAEALALAQGRVLAGYEPSISDSYARWVEERTDAVRFEVLRVLGGWLETARRTASWPTIEAIARRMLTVDGSRADAAAALAESIDRQGRPSRDAAAGVQQTRRLIGRDEVMARLIEGLTSSDGPGYRVGVAGPPGMGKSRVLGELERAGAARGAQVGRLRCQRGDALRPLSLAVDLTRALLEMRGALGASPESIEVLRRFVGEQPWPDEDGDHETRRAAVFAAMRDLVGAVTDEEGLLVAIDDAQWADPGSWLLLAPVFAHHSTSMLCWAVAIRAEAPEAASAIYETIFPSDDAASERQRELVWLEPLTPESVAEVAAARAAPRAIPAAVIERLTPQSAGIPFITEALVDHWLDAGDLSSLPPSVRRLVRSRLDRLAPRDEQLLRVIAVLGPDATSSAVETVAHLDRRDLLDALLVLERSGIVRTEDGVFRAHALWTEAALARAPKTVLQLLHRYAAQWLEGRVALEETLDPRHLWSVAAHWLEAADHAEARRALDHAADVLVKNGFVVEAAAMLERAGDGAGCSAVALELWRRSATLWALELDTRASEAIVGIHARYDRVAKALDPEGFTPHHDVEAISVAVSPLRRPEVDGPAYAAGFLRCASATDATPRHRRQALARALNMYDRADMDRSLTIAMWEEVSRLVPTDEDEARDYEYAASNYFGRVVNQREEARAHAGRVVAMVMTEERMLPSSAVMIANTASLYECIDELEESFRVRRALADYAIRWKWSHALNLTLSGLIGTFLELGRHEEARALLPAFGRPKSNDGKQLAVERARSIYWAVCALEAGDARQARADAPPLEAAEGISGMSRARILSIHAHLALLEGDDVTFRGLVEPLLGCFTRPDVFMDHPALLVAIGLERFEGWDAAAAFVRRYLDEFRLERWTPRRELQRYLEPQAPPD